jgi:RNA polymerase sigma-70 factor (ECF subfamily)
VIVVNGEQVLLLERDRGPVGLCSDEITERNRAWNALYDEHMDAVYRLVRCLGVPDADAEDIVQRVFLVAHRKARQLEQVQNMRAWLRTVAVRAVSDYRRWRRVRRLNAALLQATCLATTPPVQMPEQSALSDEVRRLVNGVLNAMSPKLRDVLVLIDLEGCAPGEVAGLLGVPVNTVRSRRRLAREAFCALWEGEDDA